MSGPNRPVTTQNKTFVSGVSSYIVRSADDIINIDTSGGPVTVFLPNIKSSGLNQSPKPFCINDQSGDAATNNITIQGLDGDLVNGGGSTIIAKDKGSAVCIICNTNEWLVGKDTDSSSAPITGGGTTNFIAKFDSPVSIADSMIFDNGISVGLGTSSPSAASLFQLDSTTQGFAPPRMTTGERDLIGSPFEGLQIHNLTTNQPEFYNGSAWQGFDTNTNVSNADLIMDANHTLTMGAFTLTMSGTTDIAFTSGGEIRVNNSGALPLGFGEKIIIETNVDEYGWVHTDSSVILASYIGTFSGSVAGQIGMESDNDLKIYGYNGGNYTGFICFLNDVTDTNAYWGVNVSTPTAEWDVNGNIRVRGLTVSSIPQTDASGNISVGTWQYVGNNLVPLNNGVDIGDASNRISTIYMSSTVDYSGDLTFVPSAPTGQQYFWIETDGTSPNQKRVTIAPNGYTTSFGDFNYKAADTSGFQIEGFNGNDNQFSLRVYSNGKTLRSLAVENNSDIVMCEDTTASRARLTIGTVTSVSNAKVTIRGINTSAGNLAIYAGGSTGTTGFQGNNDNRFGFGAQGTTSTKVNIRGIGSSGTTITLGLQNSGGVNNFLFYDNGRLSFRAQPESGQWGVGYNITSTSTSTANEQSASVVFEHEQTPTVNGTSRGVAVWASTEKRGAFNSNETTGVFGEGRNLGTGNATVVRGILAQARFDTASTVSRGFGLETNTIAFSGATNTITDFGGINVRLEASQAGTNITNMYGIVVQSPTNTGGAITNTYGIRLNENTQGTSNNYGVYQEGTTIVNIFEGEIVVGASSQSVNMSEVEVSGDIEVIGSANGLILESPDATRYRVTMLNGGTLDVNSA